MDLNIDFIRLPGHNLKSVRRSLSSSFIIKDKLTTQFTENHFD